jgi:ureidoglycolate lyase
MAALLLKPKPLTREAFAPFGDVIETEDAESYLINEGTTERFHDLAKVELGGGRALINIFRAQPRPSPIAIRMMERHPLGSQAFIALERRPFLVVVAPRGAPPEGAALKAFITDGNQGVNYHPGVWHHPVLALVQETDFLVIDRGGLGANCDEVPLPEGIFLVC